MPAAANVYLDHIILTGIGYTPENRQVFLFFIFRYNAFAGDWTINICSGRNSTWDIHAGYC